RRDPGGFQICTGDAVIVVQAKAQKGVVFLIDCIVKPNAGQVALRRLLRDMVLAEHERVCEGDGTSANLVVPLIIGKEEELIFFDRPSDGSAVLPPHEEGVFETFERGGDVAQRVASGRVAGALEDRKGGALVVE